MAQDNVVGLYAVDFADNPRDRQYILATSEDGAISAVNRRVNTTAHRLEGKEDVVEALLWMAARDQDAYLEGMRALHDNGPANAN